MMHFCTVFMRKNPETYQTNVPWVIPYAYGEGPIWHSYLHCDSIAYYFSFRMENLEGQTQAVHPHQG